MKKINGYFYVQFHPNGKITNFYIHQLVIKAFIGPRPEKMDVDHIDRNRQNNHISNLRYVTRSENNRNAEKRKPYKLNKIKGCVCKRKDNGKWRAKVKNI